MVLLSFELQVIFKKRACSFVRIGFTIKADLYSYFVFSFTFPNQFSPEDKFFCFLNSTLAVSHHQTQKDFDVAKSQFRSVIRKNFRNHFIKLYGFV